MAYGQQAFPLDNFDGTKGYVWLNARSNIVYNEATNNIAESSNVDFTNKNHLFKLSKKNNKYSIYSVGGQGYVQSDLSVSSTETWWSLGSSNSTGQYPFDRLYTDDNHYLNLNGSNQLISSKWKDSDAGNQFSFYCIEDVYYIGNNYSRIPSGQSVYMVGNDASGLKWTVTSSPNLNNAFYIKSNDNGTLSLQNLATLNWVAAPSKADFTMSSSSDAAASIGITQINSNIGHYHLTYNSEYVHARALEEYCGGNSSYQTPPYAVMNAGVSGLNTQSDWYFYIERPSISVDASGTVTMSCSNGTIFYTTDGSVPTSSSTKYNQSFTVNPAQGYEIYAVVGKQIGSIWVYSTLTYISKAPDIASTPTSISSLSEINDIIGNYKLTADVEASGTVLAEFKGKLDGDGHSVSGLNAPLFAKVNGAVICNLNIEGCNISVTTGNAGAIAAEAMGASRIYNCGVLSGSVSGTDKVGSLVGLLDGSSRVINCFSYADVTGGTDVGGIVGYNNYASTANDLRTMVMNCMYYGSITGITISPVYGGLDINNAASNGLNNYNYYPVASGIVPTNNKYNGALPAEERFLKRFEFYRGILNSNKRLFSYYVFGDLEHTSEMYKWVLDENYRYPVLKKEWKYYPSPINPDYAHASETANPYEGRKLGDLSVTIGDKTVSLPITDMDTLHYDFTYGKIQLPYYNDYFDDNYGSKGVVTGWKVEVTSSTGTYNSFSNYNYADKDCIDKDKERIFAQGGYYIVPNGVTAVKLTPYWAANVAYLSGKYLDRANYGNSDFTTPGATPTGTRTVYNDLQSAINALPSTGTVYDNAIVLVGNYVSNVSNREKWTTSSKTPFTVMSIDEDRDNEPDYCLFHYHSDRKEVNPVRFDFLWHPGKGMAFKPTKESVPYMYNQGIFKPYGWFEITETCVARYTEFEFDYKDRTQSPIILNNGIYDELVSGIGENDLVNLSNNTTYMIIGGHCCFVQFTCGTHTGKTYTTKHFPISVLGGEFNEFYLTAKREQQGYTADDGKSVNLYTCGGYFRSLASAYMESIEGDVNMNFCHSLFGECYGGGMNANQPVKGNINVKMDNCWVKGLYCGGPKFGDMTTGMKVTTISNESVFNRYFGAGYGGTSLAMNKSADDQGSGIFEYSANWFTSFFSSSRLQPDTQGILAQYAMEFKAWAGGNGGLRRFYQYYASLSAAQTNDVTSTLTNCTITNDLYGGGNLGTVRGNIETTLTNCTVGGNAYAGGFSAEIPYCEVFTSEAPKMPIYNKFTGLYTDGVIDRTKSSFLKWSSDETNESDKKIYTKQDLTALGKVTGNVSIQLDGTSLVHGSVFGGGNASGVTGNTTVRILGSTTVEQNVYGGGNEAEVGGTTTVQIGEECVTTSTNSENGGE